MTQLRQPPSSDSPDDTIGLPLNGEAGERVAQTLLAIAEGCPPPDAIKAHAYFVPNGVLRVHVGDEAFTEDLLMAPSSPPASDEGADQASEFTIEQLCAHHDMSEFRCGNDDYDTALWKYQQDSSQRASALVLVLVKGRKIVRGYVALVDVELISPTGETRWYLMPAALAIHSEDQGGAAVARLIKAAREHITSLRQAGRFRYDGILAVPQRIPRSVLQAEGFRQVPENAHLWVLPQPSLHDPAHADATGSAAPPAHSPPRPARRPPALSTEVRLRRRGFSPAELLDARHDEERTPRRRLLAAFQLPPADVL